MKSFLDPERRAELQQRWDEIERLLSEQFDCKPCGSDPHFIEGQLLQEQAKHVSLEMRFLWGFQFVTRSNDDQLRAFLPEEVIPYYEKITCRVRVGYSSHLN